MLEVASELVGGKDWVQRQATISLRHQGQGNWQLTFFASDDPGVIDDVVSGKVQVAIMNPVDPLALAYRGTGPYTKPLPLSVVTVIPSEDQMAFAVSERTGVTSLEEIRERRVPLRVSLRKQPGHSTHFYIKHILDAAGFSLDDIKSWGGEVRYDAAIPQASERLGAIEVRERAYESYDVPKGILRGAPPVPAEDLTTLRTSFYLVSQKIGDPPESCRSFHVLPIEEDMMRKFEAMGFRRSILKKDSFPNLAGDTMSLDFSGWAVFTRADAPDDFITAFCRALEARKDRIAWQGEGPLPLESMCRNTPDTPLVIPLHPAAERFWRDCGYLP